jgi:hypothetical protein
MVKSDYIRGLESRNNNEPLTIFQYLSIVVLPQKNKSDEYILRKILFNNCNRIDWNNVKQLIEQEHPEMTGYEWNENCMYTLPYEPITSR